MTCLLELTWLRGGSEVEGVRGRGGASAGLLLVAGRWHAGFTDGARLQPQSP